MKQRIYWLLLLLALLAACVPGETAVSPTPTASDTDTGADETAHSNDRLPADRYAEYDIVTLLPRDGIPAIDDPEFVSAAEASDSYDPDELVIGVVFNGDSRAYSVPLLSNHEIVNDTVGGVKIAVTW
ncbi:MAG: DUF3179 domain-containing protein [Anaerolineales bacterium]|nr:DUF3179 domain-containing protein [Anaerolineales bacterium]